MKWQKISRGQRGPISLSKNRSLRQNWRTNASKSTPVSIQVRDRNSMKNAATMDLPAALGWRLRVQMRRHRLSRLIAGRATTSSPARIAIRCGSRALDGQTIADSAGEVVKTGHDIATCGWDRDDKAECKTPMYAEFHANVPESDCKEVISRTLTFVDILDGVPLPNGDAEDSDKADCGN